MDNIDILARTLYGEAEAGNIKDATAIAHVVVNRVGRAYWPDSVAEVCLQPWQFSCWNQNDPNRVRILAASGSWFEKCKVIAAEVIKSGCNGCDPTSRSTHYYQSNIKEPKWARNKRPIYKVGHKSGAHLFYNNIDTLPPKTAAEALEQISPIKESRTVRGAQVAAGATVLGVCGEAIQQMQPVFPLLQTLAQYSPFVLAGLALAGLTYLMFARYEDRKKGLR